MPTIAPSLSRALAWARLLDEFHLLEGSGASAAVQLGLVDWRVGGQIRGRALTALVAVVTRPAVVPVPVAAARTAVVAPMALVDARVLRSAALDPRRRIDPARQRRAVVARDRQHTGAGSRRVLGEARDRADRLLTVVHPVVVGVRVGRARVLVHLLGVPDPVVIPILVGVVHAVVVGVLVARVRARAELAEVAEPVAIRVSLGALLVRRQVELLLPLVRQLVVVAVARLGHRGAGHRKQRGENDPEQQQSDLAHLKPSWSRRVPICSWNTPARKTSREVVRMSGSAARTAVTATIARAVAGGRRRGEHRLAGAGAGAGA